MAQRVFSNAPAFLIGLVGPLSIEEPIEDAVRGGHIDTDARQNDASLILLALYVPWQQLPQMFQDKGATISSYVSFCSQLWDHIYPSLEEYIRFAADNMMQMRKGRIGAKLDPTSMSFSSPVKLGPTCNFASRSGVNRAPRQKNKWVSPKSE